MAKMPEMNSDFARWYAESFMDESVRRETRWKGVVDVTAKADHLTAEVLTRLAFQTPVPASGRKNEELGGTYSKVIPVICGGDVGFDPAHSARELQFLAAAALVRLVATLPDAALIVTTASFGGSRKPELPMNLAGAAERGLVTLAARKHARTRVEELKLAAPKVEFTVAPEALQSMDPTLWKSQLDNLHDATAASIERVVTAQNRVFELLHKQISLDEEELQMLWWLLGGFSQQLEKTFAEIDSNVRPLALAFELGEMTAVAPGPASIRAMLSRAGVGTEELKLVDVVNAVDIGWAKSVSDPKLVSPVSTPIHFALEQRAELASDDTWQSGWSGLTGLSVDVALPAVKLAELFYREHLFINVNA